MSELFNSYTSYDHKVSWVKLKYSFYLWSYDQKTKQLGSKFSVLVTEVSHDEQYYVAHNKFYEQVIQIKNMERNEMKKFEIKNSSNK